MNAVSIRNKDFTVEYTYKSETKSLRVVPLKQNFGEIVIKKPDRETVIEFRAYITSTREPMTVNGNATYTFRSRTYRKKAFIIIGEKRK